jgi:hypothetical protein
VTFLSAFLWNSLLTMPPYVTLLTISNSNRTHQTSHRISPH